MWELLLVLLALFAFALVGHTLWLMGAGVVRVLFGSAATPAEAARNRCLACGEPLYFPRCSQCGFDPAIKGARELLDLTATTRELERLIDAGLIDRPTYERLQLAVEQRQARLLGKPAPTRRPVLDVTPVIEVEVGPPDFRIAPGPVRERTEAPPPPVRDVLPVEPVEALPAAEPVLPVLKMVEEAPPLEAGPVEAAAPLPVYRMEPAPVVPALPVAAAPEAPAPRQRRNFAEVLHTFMERSNILWGELVGGLLIVGCSIALVLSLWSKFADNPIYQSAIFASLTAMLFGAGLYTLHHWKLESTSRGLLIIAALLVPLNFLATASQAGGAGSVTGIILEVGTLGLFAWLLLLTGRVLVPAGGGWFALAVLGTSASSLLFPRLLGADHGVWLMPLLGVLPAACHVLGCGGWIVRRYERADDEDAATSALFTLLGVSLFAVIVALGLLASWGIQQGAELRVALAALTLPAALAALPLISGGLRAHQAVRVDDDVLRKLAGTAAALTGVTLMLAAVVLAWGEPSYRLAVSGFNVLVLSWVAYRWRLPILHAAALACLGAAYLTGIEQAELAMFVPEGALLVPLFVLLAVASELLARFRSQADAGYHAAAAGVVAAYSLFLITPWHLTAAFEAKLPAILYLVYGAAALLLNARWQKPALSALSIALLAGGTLWALAWQLPGQIAAWSAVLAAEAIVLGFLAQVLGRFGRLAHYREPFARSAEAMAPLALMAALYSGWPLLGWSMSHVVAGVCLSGLFLLLASVERSVLRAQIASGLMIATTLVATTCWLTGQDWFMQHALDPRTWQAYGIGLGLLCLGWTLARIGLQRLRPEAWLEHGLPTLEHGLLAFIAIAQLGLASVGLLPAVFAEWGFDARDLTLRAHCFGPLAWQLAGLMFVALTACLWERRAAALALPGLFVAALTLPVLLAGGHEPEQAAAMALRWSLAGLFFIGSALIWLRDPLAKLAAGLGCALNITGKSRYAPQAILLGGALWPVLLLTAFTGGLPFLGATVILPAENTLFMHLGWIAALAIPLMMLCAACAGHALRERSGGFAFGGGLIALCAVMMWHALDTLFAHPALDVILQTKLTVQLVQLGGLTASLWALGWLGLRQRLGITDGNRYLDWQASVVAIGALLAPAIAVGQLFLSQPPAVPAWTVATGSLLGWVSLLACSAALVVYAKQRRLDYGLRELGFAALALMGMYACSVSALAPDWGYRTLMIGWSALALVWVLAGWLVALRTDEEGYLPHDWVTALTLWVPVASVLGTLLGVKAALAHDDLLWAALAIALSSPALAGLGVWRREEGWAFAAGLGVNLAASLVVFHFQRGLAFIDWWPLFLQANAIATAAVALLWLTLRQCYYGSRELTLNTSKLLALQVTLAGAVNFFLLATPALTIFNDPGLPLSSTLLTIGHGWGWLGFLLTLGAAGWYADQVLPPTLTLGKFAPRSSALAVGLLACLGLGVGSLSACLVSGFDNSQWLAYHVLMADIVIAAFACLGVAWWLARIQLPRPLYSGAQGWIVMLTGLVLVLALRGAWSDPLRPYWSTWAVLCLAGVYTSLTVWTPRKLYVLASGLMLNLAAFLIWAADSSLTSEHFYAGQTIALALAALGWTGWRLATAEKTGDAYVALHVVEEWFTRLAGLAALVVLIALAGNFTVGNLIGHRFAEPSPLTWVAFGLTAALFVVRLWHNAAREVPAALFAIGLVGIALALDGLTLSPRAMCQYGTLALAGFTLLTAFVPGRADLWKQWKLTGPGSTDLSWFVPAQLGLAALVMAGGLWLSLDFLAAGERFQGTLAIALLLPGFVRLARVTSGQSLETFDVGEFLRYFALGLGAVALGAAGWALVDPIHTPLWVSVHRVLIFQVTLSFVTVLYGVVLARQLPDQAWANDCRRAGPVFGLLALLALVVVLVQEGLLYNADDKIARLLAAMQLIKLPADFQIGVVTDPMSWLAVGVIGIALIGLIVAGIAFAVAPEADPFGLSERGRMWYVYGVELVGLLLFLHFKITREELFRQGVFVKYWPFLVMLIAFIGAGLSEFFSRRRLRVLAEPLGHTGMFLPLLPILAFWVMPPSHYANLWFTAGLLYGVLARTRGSFTFAILAALSANVGLWVLLFDRGLMIWEHPQLWLIPPALIGLASEHINRDRLTAAQSNSIRYLALLVVYVSSTADMFIAGLGESWLLPIVLVSLSVAGILLGMLLRIRAFLLLGSSFLTLVIFTMIWYAGVQQERMWIVYAFGIVLGAAIITLFGIFEKRRNDVLRVIDDLKRWR